MKILDVNVLVYAFRSDVKEHGQVRRWLEDFLETGKPFGVPDIVFSGFIRTVTRRPFQPASKSHEAWRFVNAMLSIPGCALLHGSSDHFAAFRSLADQIHATGNILTDAWIAAFAVISDGEIVSCDEDYKIFPGLSWRNPLNNQLRTNPR